MLELGKNVNNSNKYFSLIWKSYAHISSLVIKPPNKKHIQNVHSPIYYSFFNFLIYFSNSTTLPDSTGKH